MEHNSNQPASIYSDIYADIISRDLLLNNEQLLPKAFLKVLLDRFCSDASRNISNKFAEAFLNNLSHFCYTVIMIRMRDTALVDIGVDPELVDSDCVNIQKKIYEYYLSALRSRYSCFPVLIEDVPIFVTELSWMTASGNTPYRSQIKELEEFLLDVQQNMYKEFGFIAQAIISEVKNELYDMPEAFQQILFSIDYVFYIYPEKNVVTFLSPMEKAPDTSSLHPKPEIERLYFESILKNDFSLANNILRSIIEQQTADPSTALSVRLRIQSRMAWTLTLLGLPRNHSLSQCVAIYDCVTQAIVCKTIGELNACIDNFFHGLEIYYRKVPLGIANKIDVIIRYVKENYSDPNISVGSICEVFGVTPSHLSRIFKKKTGIKLIDYIHLTRLEKAKELLKDETLSINSIANQIGYAGNWALIRVFKRFEGITPSDFRSAQKNG